MKDIRTACNEIIEDMKHLPGSKTNIQKNKKKIRKNVRRQMNQELRRYEA